MEDSRSVTITKGDAIVWVQHPRAYKPSLTIRTGYVERLTDHRVVAVNEDHKDERLVEPRLVVVVGPGMVLVPGGFLGAG